MGVQANFADQARVFGHDAVAVAANTNVTGLSNAALYVGGAGNVHVTMQSGNAAIFKQVNAGTFLPILVTGVDTRTATDASTATDILAIY
jgi:hypothetical protein|tara:strand:+ start:1512 stop:1781 length:270 start_codon:yes stop_codon:yes gene_type:complete